MPFVAGERRFLIDILKLSREQDTDHSKLQHLMKCLEHFDTRNSTTYVGEVQALILEYGTLQADEPNIVKNPDGIQEAELDRDYRIKFFDQVGIQEENFRQGLSDISNQIWNILDPDGELLCYKNNESRIFESL